MPLFLKTGEEAFLLIQQWDEMNDRNTTLKKNQKKIAGIASAIILLLAGSIFGATFVAVHLSKETSVDDSGALMSKDGSHELSTLARGTRLNLFNSSDDTPLCIHVEEFEAIKESVLVGSKVILDIEYEGNGTNSK